jgi:hypothetical protein
MSTSPSVERRPQSRRWQFSLFTLLVAMTGVGLACVALVSPSQLWTGLVFVLAVGSLLLAGLCIVYRDGRTRAFAVGFVIFGTAYFLVSMGDTPDVPDAPTQLPTTRWGIALYRLVHGEGVPTYQTVQTSAPVLPAPWPSTPATVTSFVPQPPIASSVEQVDMTVPTDAPAESAPNGPAPAVATTTPPVFLPSPVTYAYAIRTTQPNVTLSSFLSVVHFLLVLALGVLGGTIAQILHATRRQEPAAQQPAA